MSDFFREVDEELRNERMRNLWHRYKFVIIGAALMVVVGTGAYRGYIYWQDTQAAASGDRFLEALEMADGGDVSGARAILDELANEGHGNYPQLVRFRQATLLLQEGRADEALQTYESLAQDNALTSDLQDFATLQAAMIAVDTEDYEMIRTRVSGLIAGDNPWRFLAREALALSAFRSADLTEAGRWVVELREEPTLPQGLRQRMQILEDLIISRGGTLPEREQS